MVTKFWSKQLLMIKPDPSPYLMASNRYRLYAGAGTPLYWTNNAQVRVNTLDNKNLGSQAFSVSFSVSREFVILSTGTRYILSYPGLMDVKAEDGMLWFKFNWEARPVWKYISSSELVPGWNNVSLAGNGVKITLTVNNTIHTLFGGAPRYTVVNFPVKTESDQAILNQILASGTWEVSDGVLKNVKVSDSFGTAYAHFTLHTTGACSFGVDASISSEQNYDFGAVYIGSDIYEPTQSQLKAKTTDGKGNYLVIGSGTTLEGGPNTFVDDDNNIAIKLAENTDYVVSFAYAKDTSGAKGEDCLKIYKYGTSSDEPKYPMLSLGVLKTHQSWTVLKDVEAQYLGE